MYPFNPSGENSAEYLTIDALLLHATTAEEIRALYFRIIRDRLKMSADERQELENDMLFKIMHTMQYGKK